MRTKEEILKMEDDMEKLEAIYEVADEKNYAMDLFLYRGEKEVNCKTVNQDDLEYQDDWKVAVKFYSIIDYEVEDWDGGMGIFVLLEKKIKEKAEEQKTVKDSDCRWLI